MTGPCWNEGLPIVGGLTIAVRTKKPPAGHPGAGIDRGAAQ